LPPRMPIAIGRLIAAAKCPAKSILPAPRQDKTW
jgi:hypothetical protein